MICAMYTTQTALLLKTHPECLGLIETTSKKEHFSQLLLRSHGKMKERKIPADSMLVSARLHSVTFRQSMLIDRRRVSLNIFPHPNPI